MMHVLPNGFVRIRYYGFLANAHRKEQLRKIRELLDAPQPAISDEESSDPSQDLTRTGPRSALPSLQRRPDAGRRRRAATKAIGNSQTSLAGAYVTVMPDVAACQRILAASWKAALPVRRRLEKIATSCQSHSPSISTQTASFNLSDNNNPSRIAAAAR